MLAGGHCSSRCFCEIIVTSNLEVKMLIKSVRETETGGVSRVSGEKEAREGTQYGLARWPLENKMKLHHRDWGCERAKQFLLVTLSGRAGI